MPDRDDLSQLQVLYLTTTGRVSGLARQIEIWFVTAGGKLYLLAEHFQKTQWVQNIQRNPRVRVRLGGLEFGATARALEEERDNETWQAAQRLAREKWSAQRVSLRLNRYLGSELSLTRSPVGGDLSLGATCPIWRQTSQVVKKAAPWCLPRAGVSWEESSASSNAACSDRIRAVSEWPVIRERFETRVRDR
jgi:deazaflavin-dependent oxidoreductase (nitroreductase family)